MNFFCKLRQKSRFLKISTKIQIFRKYRDCWKNFDHNRDFLIFRSKSGFLENFDQNRGFKKFRPKSRFVKNFDQNRDLSKISTKIDFFFFTISTKIAIFENFDHQNRDLSNIWTNIEIFRKFRPKSRFSKILTKIKIFWKFRPMSRFSKFRPKSRFSKISTKIENFAYFDQNRDFCNSRPKSRFFSNFDQIGDFSKISTKLAIFLKFRKFFQNQDLLQISIKSIILKMSSKTKICCKFRQKLRFKQNFDKNRDFRTFPLTMRFVQNLTKIEIFFRFRPKRDF